MQSHSVNQNPQAQDGIEYADEAAAAFMLPALPHSLVANEGIDQGDGKDVRKQDRGGSLKKFVHEPSLAL